MARVLLVGCGCRGQALARELVGAGHAVRGTTREPARAAAIAAAGAEPFVADPDRVATLMPALENVTIACWLLARAAGEPAAVDALHGPRLRFFLGKIVDTGVRGFLYEVPEAGTSGRAAVEEAAATWLIPVGLLEAGGTDRGWIDRARAAVDGLLA